MKRAQFRIKTLLIITAFTALGVAWWIDHRRMQSRINELETPEVMGPKVRLYNGEDLDFSLAE